MLNIFVWCMPQRTFELQSKTSIILFLPTHPPTKFMIRCISLERRKLNCLEFPVTFGHFVYDWWQKLKVYVNFFKHGYSYFLIRCIVRALKDPNTFLFDHLLALKPVKFLEGELIHDVSIQVLIVNVVPLYHLKSCEALLPWKKNQRKPDAFHTGLL